MGGTRHATLAFFALQAFAGEPHRSFQQLPFGNGFGAAVYDSATQRIVTLTEHAYRFPAPDAPETRNFCFDAYLGLRIDGAGEWLTESPADDVAYVEGTGVVRAVSHHGDVVVEQFFFMPWELSDAAVVAFVRVENVGSAAHEVSLFSLHNFHVGNGAPNPDALGEEMGYDATRDAFYEWGAAPNTLAHVSLEASTHHSCSPDNPFLLMPKGEDLSDRDGTQGPTDDAVAGFQRDLGLLAPGQAAFWAVATVIAPDEDAAPVVDRLRAWMEGRSLEQLMSDEIAAWQTWQRETEPLAKQAAVVLRMAQVREPAPAHGQILASLPPGAWNIAWVRDMAYAVVALARAGYLDEARAAIAFQLGAEAGRHVSEVGQSYAISVTRYFGNGVEESDSNENGPNIELDGFGLFLWSVAEVVQASGDISTLKSWWPTIREGVADVLVALQEDSGLMPADSSIWEVHWNGQQRHFSYTTIAAAKGLCAVAEIAETLGDSESAVRYAEAGARSRDAVTFALANADGVIAQSREDLARGYGYLDAAAVEAINFGLLNPVGPTAASTLDALVSALTVAPGRGLRRNDDGGWYDAQEWVFVDLRAAVAMQSADLVAWVSAQALENDGLLPELLDATTADYAGSVPMAGFGAGAFLLAQSDSKPDGPLCGQYAQEAAMAVDDEPPSRPQTGCGCALGAR